MSAIEAPLLYTPGDNEWTDCYRRKAGAFEPLERLARLRAEFFAEPGMSLGGAPVPLTHQGEAGYPENARMMEGGVMFITAHVVGSNNNFEVRDPDAVAEFFARDAAAINWLREGFAAAGEANASALVLAIHADMFTPDFAIGKGWTRHSGFKNFGEAFVEAAAAYDRPVLLIFGDTHVFEQLRPFPVAAPNVLAVQVPGAQAMHAVEITVNPGVSAAFALSLLKNPALAN